MTLHTGTSKQKTKWVIDPKLLGAAKKKCVTRKTRTSTPPPDIASLVREAADELESLKELSLPVADTPPRRAKNFPFKPDAAAERSFRALGFMEWLQRVKRDQSAEATIKQLAEFIAWFKQAKCVMY